MKLSVILILLLTSVANAWDQHVYLMPWVLRSLPATAIQSLKRPLRAPCLEEDHAVFERLRKDLFLNPSAKFETLLQPTVADCKKPTSAYEILSREFVDDPDGGMDQDLPDSADPEHERKWMGGEAGLSSQGFRHMYFGGWKLTHPLLTFQIPLHAIGRTPEHTQLVSEEARRLFAEGKTAWGWRVVAWTLHYLQDLAQPFHAVQVINFKMVPWENILDHFIAETTRIITNYHWAYEGLTLAEVQMGNLSPLKSCLLAPDSRATYQAENGATVMDLSLAIARASVELGGPLGRDLVELFTLKFKGPQYDFKAKKGVPDYTAIAQTPSDSHAAVDAVSCHALGNALHASHELIQSFLQPNRPLSAAQAH